MNEGVGGKDLILKWKENIITKEKFFIYVLNKTTYQIKER